METLSDKIVQGGCIEDCACNSGDKDYHPELKEHETHFFLNTKDVREFIKKLKEEIKQGVERNGVLPLDWCFDRIDKLAGEKLT